MEIGDQIKRNFSPIFATSRDTDTRIKTICSGALYEIIKKSTTQTGYKYQIKNTLGDTYTIAHIDLNDHFYKIDEAGKSPEKPAESRKCTCCSISLREFGCKCGCIANMLDQRCADMQREMFGPRIEDES